ncbi:hypothetical protein R1flu_004310 [Riccia fluitans]|uniref:Ubiquitin-like protease family profile domain-containing protein n=1 Tax=Riccia fluitans TaxID=41844 RepID=A0ABD1YPY4_9MARC
MKIKKDGHLVEPLDPDVDAKSQKTPKKKQTGLEQPSRKRPRSESDPKDGNEGNLPSTVETSWKGKGKVTKSSHRPDVDTDVDISAKERRTLTIGMMANRLEMDPPLSTSIGQTSGRGSNHIPSGDTTKEVPPTSSKVPSDGILKESVSQMTIMLSNVIEYHGRKNQPLASLKEDLAHAKLEDEKLKATIEALEKEKSEMDARVALMERKDLYDLLEPSRNDWRSIFPTTVLDCAGSSISGSHSILVSPENEGSEDQGWPCKNDLMKADLESTMYKGCYLRGDVINMYINEAFLKKPRKQLHNMFYMNTFWFTKASELVARYDKTNHAVEAMIKITRLRKSICPQLHDEDMQGNLPVWIFVPIHGKNHWSLAIIRLHNDDAWLAHLDSSRGTHDPEAIFHILKQVLCLIVPIDPALVMTGIMNVEQQQDGYSCGKHVLQMLTGAAMKESDGLDRCFREEGLGYISTLDQVRSFDVVFGIYLSGKLAGPPM